MTAGGRLRVLTKAIVLARLSLARFASRASWLSCVVGAACALCVAWPAAPALAQGADPRVRAQLEDGAELLRSKRPREAIARFDAALSTARAIRSVESEVDALQYLALANRDVPDLRRVLALRQQVLALVRAHPEIYATAYRREEPWALHELAGAHYLLGDLQNAIRASREAVALEAPRVTRFDTVGLGRFRQRLGQLLFLDGQAAAAEKALDEAYADFETRLQLGAGAGAGPNPLAEYGFEIDVLRWLQRALVAQGRSDEALEVAERGRARTLAAATGSRLANTLAARPLGIAGIKALARSQQSTFVAYTVVYELDPDLLLEFSDFEQTRATALLIWVIRPDGTGGFRQVDLAGFDSSLAEMIAQARRGIGATGRGSVRGPAQQASQAAAAPARFAGLQRLYRVLIEPIQDLLPGAPDSRVTVLPQDLLYTVPFAALQDGAGRFLASRYAIAFNPSFSAFEFEAQMLRRAIGDGRGVMVLGNPAMPTVPAARGRPAERLMDLPQAESEARDIAALFGARPLVGRSATKPAVVDAMRGARIVHLATHGLMDDERERAPYFNALALAPSAGDAGFLAAREIGSLKLNAELVVLSACDTADGKPTGDAVLGFSSAFLAAGAASVVVAQWSIPDAPTAALMREFYAGLLRGRDKPAALQQAMLATMKQHPHPANWAAFVLFGDPGAGAGFASIRGNGPAGQERDGAAAQGAILLPGEISGYMELNQGAGPPSAMYQTRMTIAQVFAFYRDAYAKRGYAADAALTRVEATTGSLVLRGAGGRKLVVQVVEFADPLGREAPMRHVSARFEAP